MIFLLLFSFLGFAHFIVRWAKVAPGTAIFLTAASVLSSVYALGFTGHLRELVFALFALGLGFAGFFAFKDFRSIKKSFRETLTAPSTLVFTALSLLFYFSFRDAWFLGWDEIGHWGLVLKEMLLYNRNLKPGDLSWLSIYPPGAAAFQYYFCAVLGPQEGHAYVAEAILMLAPLVQLLDLKSPRCSVAGRGVFIAGFCLIFAFFNGWKMIYVDSAVSLFFGGAVIMYLLNRPFEKARLLLFAPVFVSLGLIKYIGNLLSIIVLTVIAVDQIATNWSQITATLKLDKRRFTKKLCLSLVIIGLLYGIPKLSLLVWSNRTFETILRPVVYTPREPITIDNVISVFTKEGLAEYQKTLVSRFKSALSDDNIVQQRQSFTAGVEFFFKILIGLAAIAIWRGRENRRSIVTVQLVLAAGFVLYTFGLLVLYLFRFNEYEGSNLASFARYMCIYLNAWLLVAFIQTAMTFGKRAQTFWSIAFIALAALFFPVNKLIDTFTDRNGNGGVRSDIQMNVKPVLEKVPKNEKVYVVWQKTTGFELFVHRYELAPREINLTCWGLGPAFSKEDVWTCNKPAAELMTDLQKYDFLYLGFTDEDFWNGYSSLFPEGSDPKKHRLFKIEKNGFALTALD